MATPPPTPGTTPPRKPILSLEEIIEQLETQWLPQRIRRPDGTIERVELDGKTLTWDVPKDGTGTVTYNIARLVSPTDLDTPLVDEAAHFAGPTADDPDGFITGTMFKSAQLAFELWDDLININLIEAKEDPEADIAFAYWTPPAGTDLGSHTAYGNNNYAAPIGENEYAINARRIWIDTGEDGVNSDDNFNLDNHGTWTYLHEIGHALGLSHPGSYDGPGHTYAGSAEYAHDTQQYTVMSYFRTDRLPLPVDHIGADGHYSWAATPLLHDIAAIQAKYGADLNTRAGATTYGFNVTPDLVGRSMFDFAKNVDPVVAIWDGGGIDTLDVSGFKSIQYIDLHAGSFSDIGALRQNVAIAYNCIIENAVGGWDRDTIVGNAANNRLEGRDGNDRLVGEIGRDTLIGGAGQDTLIGGAGGDTLTGGGDRDLFVFQSVADSSSALIAFPAFDLITDFTSGIDRIDLSAIDARTPLRFVDEFTGRPGELQFDRIAAGGGGAPSSYLVTADVNGDRFADFELQVNTASLSTGDFVL